MLRADNFRMWHASQSEFLFVLCTVCKAGKKRPGAQLWPVSLLRIQINSYSGCISPQIMDCVANSEIFQHQCLFWRIYVVMLFVQIKLLNSM